MRGILIVISGPAGVGKGTVVSKILERNPEIKLSISKTTRNPRFNEVNGVNYFFTSKEEFIRDIEEDNLLEYAEYNNNFYGTPKDFVFNMLNEGFDVILEIETKGALDVKKRFPDSILIFILPPSMNELYKRLKGRGTETDDEILSRMKIAENEIKKIYQYDYFVINDSIDKTVFAIENIIFAEKQRTKRFDLNSFISGVN